MTLRTLEVKKVVVDASANEHLHRHIWEMVRIADELNCEVESNFNGEIILAKPGDRTPLLELQWRKDYNEKRKHHE